MKKTKIDRLGRIVIPIQYRKALGLSENSEINIEYEERKIIITPTHLTCRICGVAVWRCLVAMNCRYASLV